MMSELIAYRPPMRTRRVMAGTALGAAGVLEAACGGESQPQQAQGTGAAAAPVELLVQARRAGSGVSEVEGWDAIVKRFNERQRRARVTFEAFPPDKGAQVLAAAGSLGDVVRVATSSSEFPSLAAKGSLRDLADHIQRDRYDFKQFHAAATETLKVRGKQFGLPYVTTPGYAGQYVNLEALTQAGIPEPDDSTWTLDNLDVILKRLAVAGRNDGTRWAAWPPTSVPALLVASRAHGGDLMSRDGKRSLLTEPGAMAGIQYVADLIVRSRLAPPPGVLQGAPANNLIQGTVAVAAWNYFLTGTLKQQAQGLRWKVLLAPKGPKGRGIYMTVDAITVGSACKAPDQAFDFVKHAISKESNLEFFDITGSVGGRIDFWEDKRITDDPSSKVFARAMNETTPANLVDNGRVDEHNAALDKELAPIWSGLATVKEAAEAARRACQEIMDRPVG